MDFASHKIAQNHKAKLKTISITTRKEREPDIDAEPAEMESTPAQLIKNGTLNGNGAQIQKRVGAQNQSQEIEKESEAVTERKQNEDESRGLSKKGTVSVRVRLCRCVMRVCPRWSVLEKVANIDVIQRVDSRCARLEKALWSLIIICCA